MVYIYDEDNFFVCEKPVEFGYQLQGNETFTRPPDGMYKAMWNGTEWVEVGKPEELTEQEPTEQEMTLQKIAMLEEIVEELLLASLN